MLKALLRSPRSSFNGTVSPLGSSLINCEPMDGDSSCLSGDNPYTVDHRCDEPMEHSTAWLPLFSEAQKIFLGSSTILIISSRTNVAEQRKVRHEAKNNPPPILLLRSPKSLFCFASIIFRVPYFYGLFFRAYFSRPLCVICVRQINNSTNNHSHLGDFQ